jgi:rRNA-processing protein FCF1
MDIMNKYIIIGLLVLSVVVLALAYSAQNYKKEGMESSQKTLCLVWRNTREGIEDRGFGDKIRGAIYCYRYCKDNGYKFKLDATEDLASNALKNVESNESTTIHDKEVQVFLDNDQIDSKLKELFNKNNTVYIFTNAYIKDELRDDEKTFIKKILEPTADFQKIVDEKVNALPANYGIQHFRFNDSVFETDVDSTDSTFKKYDDILYKTYKKTDVLFTNSTNFKKYAIKKYGIATIMCGKDVCKVGHVGIQKKYDEKVENTFIEFFVLCKAKYIKSYSTYGWVSNFVQWPAKIYDIPLNKGI